MRIIRKLIPGALLTMLGAAACTASVPHGGAPGSSQGEGSPAPGATGSIGIALDLGGGIHLDSLQYTVTNPTLAGFTTISNSIDVSGVQTVTISLTLPAASGYRLSLSAVDSAGDSCAGGPAMFDIAAGQTSTLAMNLLCTRTLDSGLIAPDVSTGNVMVTIDASLVTVGGSAPCAAAISLLTSPRQASVGESINLTGTGVDPSGATADVALSWTATGGAGSLTGTSGPATTFQCTAPGTENVTLTASMADGGASCPTIGSLAISVSCTEGSDASGSPMDATAPDAADAPAPEAAAPEAGADVALEVGTDAGATSETGADGGSLAPCMSAADVSAGNCVRCQGNTSGVCTQTEAAAVQLDINQGWIAAPGPDSNPSANGGTDTCYACLYSGACLDSTVASLTGSECEDLTATTFTAGNGHAASTNAAVQALCLDTLYCLLEITTSSYTPSGVSSYSYANGAYSGGVGTGPVPGGCAAQAALGGVQYCYCGPGGGLPSVCAGSTSGQNGICVTPETNGFTYGPHDGHDITGNYGLQSQPSGMANAIIGCALTNGCSQCLK
jgi:hypothetical protein